MILPKNNLLMIIFLRMIAVLIVIKNGVPMKLLLCNKS